MKQSTELIAEPGRCVHIGDRESDIFELFCTAHELGTHFLVRTCVDRLAGDGDYTIADEMNKVETQRGFYRLAPQFDHQRDDSAVREIDVVAGSRDA